ncbi:hypothetical protein D3C73_1325000 [compost metagenome]
MPHCLSIRQNNSIVLVIATFPISSRLPYFSMFLALRIISSSPDSEKVIMRLILARRVASTVRIGMSSQ